MKVSDRSAKAASSPSFGGGASSHAQPPRASTGGANPGVAPPPSCGLDASGCPEDPLVPPVPPTAPASGDPASLDGTSQVDGAPMAGPIADQGAPQADWKEPASQ